MIDCRARVAYTAVMGWNPLARSDRPVWVFAYANERGVDERYLRNLPEEHRRVMEVLRPIREEGRCGIIDFPFASIDQVVAAWQRNAGRVALFHFGGHADGQSLLFEAADGPAATAAAPFAEFMGGRRPPHLVVLNGCSTAAQVAALRAQGVRVVVATSRAVRDDVATEFAERFYTALALHASIGVAFQEASDAAKTKFAKGDDDDARHRSVRRDVVVDASVEHKGWPWAIYGDSEECNLVLRPRRRSWPVVAGVVAALAVVAGLVWKLAGTRQLSVVPDPPRDLVPEADGLLVDLDPLAVRWTASGPDANVQVSLENVDSHRRTVAHTLSSNVRAVEFPVEEVRQVATSRAYRGKNRIRAVVEWPGHAAFSSIVDLHVGLDVQLNLFGHVLVADGSEREVHTLFAYIDDSTAPLPDDYCFTANFTYRTSVGSTVQVLRSCHEVGTVTIQDLDRIRWGEGYGPED